MRTKYWLLAYEGTRNKWFNGDREFKKVNKDGRKMKYDYEDERDIFKYTHEDIDN